MKLLYLFSSCLQDTLTKAAKGIKIISLEKRIEVMQWQGSVTFTSKPYTNTTMRPQKVASRSSPISLYFFLMTRPRLKKLCQQLTWLDYCDIWLHFAASFHNNMVSSWHHLSGGFPHSTLFYLPNHLDKQGNKCNTKGKT